ncbi:MAG: hypothetical protein KKF33_13810 [Alphaproteobacteria bacterium]|nr:hypothetical protein [Alphaproteobacteria bacterium]
MGDVSRSPSRLVSRLPSHSPVSGGWGGALAVVADSEWNQTSYPLNPRKVTGAWQSGLTAEDILPAAFFNGTPLFVDLATGNDANNGQAGQPVKSLHRATDLINASALPPRVEVDGGPFIRDFWWNSGTKVLTKAAWFEYVGVGRALTHNANNLTWSTDASYPNARKATRSAVARVFDLTVLDEWGHYAEFSKAADAAAVNAAYHTWAQINAGADVIVNRGGGALNNNTRVQLTSNGLRTNAPLRLTGFDIEGGGGLGGCLHLQNITGNVVLENCSLRYPGSDATPRDCWFADNVNGLVAFFDCDFSSASKDGGNAHWTTDATRKTFVLTERCTGADFGRGTLSSNNAITGHESVVWIDFEGDYDGGRGGLLRFINDSRFAMFGGRLGRDFGDGSITPSAVRIDNTAQARLIDVVIETGGELALLTGDSGVIYTRNVSLIAGGASGDIREL